MTLFATRCVTRFTRSNVYKLRTRTGVAFYCTAYVYYNTTLNESEVRKKEGQREEEPKHRKSRKWPNDKTRAKEKSSEMY